jgi:hypothetical protein
MYLLEGGSVVTELDVSRLCRNAFALCAASVARVCVCASLCLCVCVCVRVTDDKHLSLLQLGPASSKRSLRVAELTM